MKLPEHRSVGDQKAINRNMRCIEILQYFEVSYLNKSNILKFYIKGSTGYQKSSMVKREDKKC